LRMAYYDFCITLTIPPALVPDNSSIMMPTKVPHTTAKSNAFQRSILK
jgi:hypothetical protein